MLLQQLKDFQWHNEPQGVFFIDEGMKVLPDKKTNFWQNDLLNIYDDNGHFFYCTKSGDFSLTTCWTSKSIPQKTQAGIMVRVDDKNWAKFYITTTSDNKPKLCSSLTNIGYSDFNSHLIINDRDKIFLRIERKNNIVSLYYSFDNNDFETVKKFMFIKCASFLKTGPFICNLGEDDFDATVSYIEVS